MPHYNITPKCKPTESINMNTQNKKKTNKQKINNVHVKYINNMLSLA